VIELVARMRPGQQVEIDFSRAHNTAAVLAGAPAPYTVGYPPRPATPAVPVTPLPRAEQVVPAVPVTPQLDRRPLDRDDVFRPGDADRDGRILDGDGRIGRDRR
jgi:hypothetical protein